MRIAVRQALAWSLCCLLLACNSGASAQNSQTDQKNAATFIDSMAKTVYNLAWPTATYRSVTYDSIEPAENGFDVIVKLSGLSALDNSDLWLKLAFMFRGGKFYDIQVRGHNAFWVPPFATTKALAGVAASLAKDYADQQKAKDAAALPPPATPSYAPQDNSGTTPAGAAAPDADDPASISAEGVCLINPTGAEVTFEYRWGDGQWAQDSLKPAEQAELWWKRKIGDPPSPQLTVRFEDDSVNPPVVRAYDLNRALTAQPPACEKLENYHFGSDGTKMVVFTGAS